MFKRIPFFMALFAPFAAHADVNAELRTMREQILQLEQRQHQTEVKEEKSTRTAATNKSAFNPEISLILSGTYGSYEQDPAAITGFALSPNDHGHTKNFNLGESELVISANIDANFRGAATFALESSGISAENAFVQTTALGNGFNAKMGRFFSGLGYLNEQHAHAWDFTDQPLVYRTFWDKQLGDDGVQLKWLAPSDTFIELGAELGRGRGSPGTDRKDTNGTGAQTLFAHLGDDFSVNSSWRAGVSWHQTRRVNAESDAFDVKNKFNGESRTAGLDFVWKYAPNGNATVTNFKWQGEYFQRRQDGFLTYDTEGTTPITDSYNTVQSGWYTQAVYQFMPRWRTGLRYDQLNSGNAEVGANLSNVPASYDFTPTRYTLMLDYSPSEFSRLRLQLAQDKSRMGLNDNQLFLQYVMSLGAHGAHKY